jgi:transcriptional regulator with XRE-family HTH domain
MKQRAIGVREAARIAEVGASTIVSWRSGASPKDYLALKKLAVALGVDLDFLLTGELPVEPKIIPPLNSSLAVLNAAVLSSLPYEGVVRVRIEKVVP